MSTSKKGKTLLGSVEFTPEFDARNLREARPGELLTDDELLAEVIVRASKSEDLRRELLEKLKSLGTRKSGRHREKWRDNYLIDVVEVLTEKLGSQNNAFEKLEVLGESQSDCAWPETVEAIKQRYHRAKKNTK